MGDRVCRKCGRAFEDATRRAAHERSCGTKRRRGAGGGGGADTGAGAGAGAGGGDDFEVNLDGGEDEAAADADADADAGAGGGGAAGSDADVAAAGENDDGAAASPEAEPDEAAAAADAALLGGLVQLNGVAAAAAGPGGPPSTFDRASLCVHGSLFGTVPTPLGCGAGAAADVVLTDSQIISIEWYLESVVLDGSSSAAYDRQVKLLNRTHPDKPRLGFTATRKLIQNLMAKKKVAPFALSEPIAVTPSVRKWIDVPEGGVRCLVRPLPAVVTSLLTRGDINVPEHFKWRVHEADSIPQAGAAVTYPAGLVYAETWDTPYHQQLLRRAVEAVRKRLDFLDLQRQVDGVHHTLYVLGVGLVIGVDGSVMSMRVQASFKPWLVQITNHGAPVRQQPQSLMALAAMPSINLRQALVTTGEGAAGAKAPDAAVRERQRLFACIAAQAVGHQLRALDTAPLIVLPAAAMPGLPAHMRLSPATSWIVPAIFLVRLPGDTPQLCDHGNLKHFRPAWWQTEDFANLKQAKVLRVSRAVREEFEELRRLWALGPEMSAAEKAAARDTQRDLEESGFRAAEGGNLFEFFSSLPTSATGGANSEVFEAVDQRGVFLTLSVDELHTWALGVLLFFLNYVLTSIVKREGLDIAGGRAAQLVFTMRLKWCPRFRRGIGPVRRGFYDGMSQSVWPGHDVRDALFALVAGIGFDDEVLPDGLRETILEALELLLHILVVMRSDSITEAGVVQCESMYQHFAALMGEKTNFHEVNSTAGRIKWFNAFAFFDDIRRHGAPLNFSFESFEAAFKIWKAWYKLTNKVNYGAQMLARSVEAEFLTCCFPLMLGDKVILRPYLRPPPMTDDFSMRGRLGSTAEPASGITWAALGAAVKAYAESLPKEQSLYSLAWRDSEFAHERATFREFEFDPKRVNLFKGVRIQRGERDGLPGVDCTVYCATFRNKPAYDLLRIFEANPATGASYVNPDPATAFLMRLCVTLVYNDALLCIQPADRAGAHVPAVAADGDAHADADEDAPDDADVLGAAYDAAEADENDAEFNPARRFGKNERLTEIPTGMCLVAGRWLSSAPGSRAKELELRKHMAGLSTSYWAPRVESPRDTLQVLHVSQVEGKAWGRPFWYKRGARGFGGGDGVADALLAEAGVVPGGGVVLGAGAGAGAAGAGASVGAASAARPVAVLVSFKFI
jgi:hypothetical protein